MNDLEAYERLNGGFIELAEAQGVPIRPTLGRKNTDCLSPAYVEADQDRWISIIHEPGTLDPQWNGQHQPAHMQVFADLDAYDVDLLWRLRCAWLNYRVTTDQAEEDLFKVLETAGVATDRA